MRISSMHPGIELSDNPKDRYKSERGLRPMIEGTGVSVYSVGRVLEGGYSYEHIQRLYPCLTSSQIDNAWSYYALKMSADPELTDI